jgi:CheY-like chemotaxis protein
MLQVLLFHAAADGGDRIRKVLADHACEAELTHVRNVSGFLAALEQWSFDAILLDYALASFESGAALAAARRWWSGVPAIALCAPGAETEGRMALREGAADYVPANELPRLTASIRRVTSDAGSRIRA